MQSFGAISARRIVCVSAVVSLALACAAGCERSNAPHTVLAKAAPAAPVVLTMAPASPSSFSNGASNAGACPNDMALVVLSHLEGAVCVDKYEASIDGQTFSHAPDGGASSMGAARASSGVKPQ